MLYHWEAQKRPSLGHSPCSSPLSNRRLVPTTGCLGRCWRIPPLKSAALQNAVLSALEPMLGTRPQPGTWDLLLSPNAIMYCLILSAPKFLKCFPNSSVLSEWQLTQDSQGYSGAEKCCLALSGLGEKCIQGKGKAQPAKACCREGEVKGHLSLAYQTLLVQDTRLQQCRESPRPPCAPTSRDSLIDCISYFSFPCGKKPKEGNLMRKGLFGLTVGEDKVHRGRK